MALRRCWGAALVLVACGGGPKGDPDAAVTPAIDAAADPDLLPPASCAGAFPAIGLARVLPATTFAAPTVVTAARGEPRRLYVAEQAGVIRVIVDGALRPEPFLTVAATTDGEYENGLLGVAFHPDYAQNGRFWIARTPSRARRVVVEEYRRAADPDRAEPAPVRVLAESAEGDGGSHNGGNLAFGPDGRLYLSVGDGRSGDARDPAFLRGKLFRLDVDAPGAGPVDLAGAIWARGLRNPWRFSFDRATGDLWIADVGQATEELEYAPAGTAGRDYGWPTVDGTSCASAGCDQTGLTPPALRANAGTVIGGHVYRGPAIPCLRGWYLYTDYNNGIVNRVRVVDGAAVDHAEIDGLAPHPMVATPATMGEDAAGELYLADHGDGELYRVIAAP